MRSRATTHMRHSVRLITPVLAIFFFALPVFGQAVRIDIPLQTYGPNVPTSGGPQPQALWIANAVVSLCTHPSASIGACQSAPITTYTDATGGTSCPANKQLVQLPGTTCTAKAGTAGNVGFWYSGGLIDYWVQGPYGTYGPYSISGGNGGGGGGSPFPPSFSVQAANSPTTGFVSDPNIKVDTTNHILIAQNENGSNNKVINVTAPPYNATGDCSTDDHNAIQAAINAAYATSPSAQVYFPKPPGGCYLTSTLTWLGVSLDGPPSGQGYATGGMIAQLRSKPGQDLFNVPDVDDVAIQNPLTGFTISNLDLVVDDSVDASASHPFRLVGRTCTDVTATASSAAITSATNHCVFSAGDVGQAITVAGAGAAGATLTTTIASVQSLTQATLTTPASTTVTNATTYISVAGISATQSVGNCALAWDNRDANTANWLTPQSSGNGMLYAVWRDVNVRSLSTHNLNHSCGFFLQGQASPYGTVWDNVNIQRLAFGFLEVPFVQNSGAGAGIGGDFNKWIHAKWDSTFPFIFYDGNQSALQEIQIGSTNGVQILDAWTPVEYQASLWNIEIPEIELATNIAFRLEGFDHTVINSEIGDASGTTFWDANDSRCISCIAIGTLNVNGYLNDITLVDAIDQVTINNNGLNDVHGRRMYNPFGGVQSSRQTALSFQRPWDVATKTADFLFRGLGATPYNSDLDLWYWPQDMLTNGTGSGVVTADTASESGYNISVGNSGNITYMTSFNALGNGAWAIGTATIPAAKVNLILRLKCDTPQNIAVTFNVVNNITHIGTTVANNASYACGSTYSTLVLAADLSSFNSNYSPSINMNVSPGLVRVAWMSLQPWDGSSFTTGTAEAGTVQADTQATVGKLTSSGNINIVPLGNPAISTAAPAATGGTLLHSTTYYYKVTAINACGESLWTNEAFPTTGTGPDTYTITLGWAPIFGATGYKVYGRVATVEQFIANVSVSPTATSYSYTDNGSITPSGALPSSNTTQCNFQLNGVNLVTGGGLSGMTAGQVPIAATASTVTSSKALGSAANNIPVLDGSGLLASSEIPNNAATTTGDAAGITGGVLGSVPYQSAPGVTGFVAPNTSVTILCLTEQGTGTVGAAPVFGSCSGSTSVAFSAITGSTNTSAAMLVGTGASLDFTGSGTIDANKINAAVVPTSATIVGTNGSKQLVDASSATLTNNTSGNAATATALAAAPFNCATGLAPTGVDASGIARNCTAYVQTICSGQIALSTAPIPLGGTFDNTAACTNALTTDSVIYTPASNASLVNGYAPTPIGNLLTLYPWVSAGVLHITQGNNAGNAGTITPGAITVNYHVFR